MTKRQAPDPAAGPLESYAQEFDAVFSKRSQREAFRRYLEGLLLPAERNKTLTALANAEPIVGSQRPRVQRLQWFLSESRWDAAAVNARRVAMLRADPRTTPDRQGVLAIDETGDRKWGRKTAHVGRQYLGSIGKVDSGVVTVSSLWADAQVYYPLAVEPFTPKQHFSGGTSDPAYRTKPQLALELVEQAVRDAIPFRAVVADSFYGENTGFTSGVQRLGVGYVLALRASHSWWAPVDAINGVEEAARAAVWSGPEDGGDWVAVERTFRDGHSETWWALEVAVGPYGPSRTQRVVVATTDPAALPELTTWYLLTNLPAPDGAWAPRTPLPSATLAEVVRLYGLRNWVEQSYKQVKHALGWREYQVRSDQAMRRHWALVCCAFSFSWWADDSPGLPEASAVQPSGTPGEAMDQSLKRGEKAVSTGKHVARDLAACPVLAGALDYASSVLAGLFSKAPTAGTPSLAGLRGSR